LTTWRTKYSLGAGELSTILLAKEIQADVAMIDERGARLLARSEGVPVLGTVGLLELGYRNGEVADLRLVYQTMLAQGAHIDKQILNQSLARFNLPTI
jgi:predicted nucleic acid-binding protein